MFTQGSNGISFPGMIHSEPNKDTPEDLSVSKDEDDEDDGDDDSEKANETAPAGVDPERLKSFNVSLWNRHSLKHFIV